MIYDFIENIIKNIDDSYIIDKDVPFGSEDDSDKEKLFIRKMGFAETYTEIGSNSHTSKQEMKVFFMTKDINYESVANSEYYSKLLDIYIAIKASVPNITIDDKGREYKVWAVSNYSIDYIDIDEKGRKVYALSFNIEWETCWEE